VDAIAQDHPGRAADMRDSNVTTQSAILGWLADVTGQKPAACEVELWRVRKGERELGYVAVYLPTGIDLRLMEADEFRRTQLCADAPTYTPSARTGTAVLFRSDGQIRRRFRPAGPVRRTACTPDDGRLVDGHWACVPARRS